MADTIEYSFNLLPLKSWDLLLFDLRLGLDFAVFAEAGIAWSESNESAMNRPRGGLGAGLRLLVPGAEMVRFDVGRSPAGDFQFHFANGSKPAAQRFRLR